MKRPRIDLNTLLPQRPVRPTPPRPPSDTPWLGKLGPGILDPSARPAALQGRHAS